MLELSKAQTGTPRGFWGHPRALVVLFMTEFFERFTYYGMRALLVLFLVAATDGANPGFGLDRATAGAIYGLFTGAVFLGSLPGGWIADRLIGQRRAILWGAVLIMLGNLILALPAGPRMFYAGLGVIVLGVGLLKPNISTVVGALYAGQSGERRDAAFSIFYMGINLGGLLAPLIAGTIGEAWNWRVGFLCAAVAMGFGILQYRLTERHLGDVGKASSVLSIEERRKAWTLVVILFGAVGVIAALFFTRVIEMDVIALAKLFGSAMLALAVVFFGFMFTFAGLSREERGQVAVIAAFFLAAVVFWAGLEQTATTFGLFARDLTDRSVLGGLFRDGVHPASWYQAVNPVLIVIFAPFFAWLWVALGARNLNPAAPFKFGVGLVLLGIGFLVMMCAAHIVVRTATPVTPVWLLLAYAFHTFSELCISPVGLSNVTKLAPAQFAGQMMGIWFLGNAIGSLFSGLIGGHITSSGTAVLPLEFLKMGLVGVGAGALMLAFARPLRRWMGGASS